MIRTRFASSHRSYTLSLGRIEARFTLWVDIKLGIHIGNIRPYKNLTEAQAESGLYFGTDEAVHVRRKGDSSRQ